MKGEELRQLARQIEQEKMNFFRSNPNQRINQSKRKSIPIKKDCYVELREIELMVAKIKYGWGEQDE